MDLTIGIILIILLIIGTIFFILSIISSIVNGVPQISTFKSDFIIMKKYLHKYNIKGKKIIDLGSGSGKTLRFFEKNFSTKTYGCEIDFSNFFISKFLNEILGYKSKIIRGNYLKIDLKKYDFIYIYLFPKIIDKAEIRIWGNAEKGTIIFSNAFKFKNHKPIEILKNEKGKEEIYIYKI